MSVHPEQEVGEEFYSNVTYEFYDDANIPSKRLGDQPYDDYGEAITWETNLFPMFISIEDREEIGNKWVEKINTHYNK